LSLIMLAGCSESEKDEVRPMDTLAPISLTLSVPADKTSTRIGDPGEDTNDMVDWDRLTIIIAYTEKTKGKDIYDGSASTMVYYDTFTKEEFDSITPVSHYTSTLSPADANGYHDYTIYLPLGTCCVYGVTYSNNQGLNLEEELSKILKDGKDHNEDIYNLQISNDYAWNKSSNLMDIAKFISVATGYATEVNVANNTLTNNRLIPVEFNSNTTSSTKRYWRMVLGRLATKLDIQWDAKGAYEKDNDGNLKYTNVKVSQFTYHGEQANQESTISGSGNGRLFPTLYTLYHQEVSSRTSVSGHTTFVNTSEISKRNGRVYHYTFPDGAIPPRLTFKLDTEKEGTTGKYNVTFDMSN
ncbi:hypothetical protein, partial [Prevotella sp.]|uniref:hypothetical protein n=1 Tax=Prevotella sp. TaxID=59823 RepID=UPI0027E3484A